jgi:glucokinase
VSLVAGVDVGGTKIDACLLDPLTGEVSVHERVRSGGEAGGRAVLATCVEVVRRLAGDRPLAAVGIGLCEFVNLEGRPTSAFTVDWRGLDLTEAFSEIAPVRLESDVRAAALAEGRLGAGRGIDLPWLYVSVGTGISCSLVIGGQPFTGARGNAIAVGAPPVEQVASGLALQRRAGCATAEEVLADPAFSEIVGEAAGALGEALAWLVNALDPAVVVIGGGLGLVRPYRETAVRAMRAGIEAQESQAVPVVPAKLGALAGAIGAGLAAAATVEETRGDWVRLA